MVIQVLTNTWKITQNVQPHISKMPCRTDTREHENLRRANRARAQNNLFSNMGAAQDASAVFIGHRHGFVTVKGNFLHQRPRQYGQV